LHLDRSGAGAVMRAPGDFQPPQMKCVDSRMGELFSSSPSDDRCSGTNNAASIFVVGARTSARETAGKLPRPGEDFLREAGLHYQRSWHTDWHLAHHDLSCHQNQRAACREVRSWNDDPGTGPSSLDRRVATEDVGNQLRPPKVVGLHTDLITQPLVAGPGDLAVHGLPHCLDDRT
jgi:hypothetical protein